MNANGIDFDISRDGTLLADEVPARIYRGNGARGYPVFSVSGMIFNVHTILCTIFHGPKPSPRHVCHHKNGNRFDFAPDNLEWTTQSANTRASFARARALGITAFGGGEWETFTKTQRRDVMRLGRAAVLAENRAHMIAFCARVGSRLPRGF